MMRGPKGLARYLILELIEEKPRYGYEIVDKLKGIAGGNWEPSYGTVYGALESLENSGYICRMESEHEDRKYFELTEKGEEMLKSEQQEKQEHRDKFHDTALAFLNIYKHLYGEDETKDLIGDIKREYQKG